MICALSILHAILCHDWNERASVLSPYGSCESVSLTWGQFHIDRDPCHRLIHEPADADAGDSVRKDNDQDLPPRRALGTNMWCSNLVNSRS